MGVTILSQNLNVLPSHIHHTVSFLTWNLVHISSYPSPTNLSLERSTYTVWDFPMFCISLKPVLALRLFHVLIHQHQTWYIACKTEIHLFYIYTQYKHRLIHVSLTGQNGDCIIHGGRHVYCCLVKILVKVEPLGTILLLSYLFLSVYNGKESIEYIM